MPYDIGDALKRIENILLGSIRRNMLRHVGEERREGFDWTMWQTEQLASIRRWSAANLKRHTKDFTRINNAAISLLQQSAVSAETQAEQTLLQTGIQRADEFFDIPDAKLDALLTATRQDLSTAEHALLRKADDVYRKAVFDANVYLQSGAGTMKDAVEMAVEDMRAKGIRAVTYRNGAQVEASSYARMALRTANVRARMAGEGRARDKAGIHTVLVPPSGIACRRCAPWMGRVLVDDVYCSGTAQEAAELGVPLLSEAIAAGFLHPQCNCSPHMFLPGISKMPEVTPEDRDEAVRRYDLTQRQRHNERQIRKWKAAEKAAPDEAARKKAAARRKSWQQANKSLCDENPGILRRDYEREKLYELPDKPIVPEVVEKEAEEKAMPTLEPETNGLTRSLERGTMRADGIHAISGAPPSVPSTPSSPTPHSTSPTTQSAPPTPRGLSYDARVTTEVRETFEKEIASMSETFGEINTITGLDVMKESSTDEGCYNDNSFRVALRHADEKNALKKMATIAQQKKQSGMWSTGHPLHAMRHEIAHAIQRQHALYDSRWSDKSDLIFDIFEKARGKEDGYLLPSIYAKDDMDEFISECIAAWCAKKRSKTVREVVEIILGGGV